MSTAMWWADDVDAWSIERLVAISRQSRAAVSVALANLQRRGIVERERGRWKLTAAGVEMLNRTAPRIEDLEAEMGCRLPDATRARLERVPRVEVVDSDVVVLGGPVGAYVVEDEAEDGAA